jgi:hypothetical protein
VENNNEEKYKTKTTPEPQKRFSKSNPSKKQARHKRCRRPIENLKLSFGESQCKDLLTPNLFIPPIARSMCTKTWLRKRHLVSKTIHSARLPGASKEG